MTLPLDELPPEAAAAVRRRKHPRWIQPMLATLTERRFSDPAWLFERKFDGERCLAFRHGAEVRLMSRNRLVISSQYPEIVAALARQPASDFVLDGEVVAFDGDRTSFSRLQRRMHISNPSPSLVRSVPVVYYVFDLVHVAGHDLSRVGLRWRKRLLRTSIRFRQPLRFSAHVQGRGEAYYAEACADGWEGVIAKRAESPYVGTRSKDWLKFKCVLEQEFVIGGFTDPQGMRQGSFGALLIGYYEGGELVYAGKVGTGFDGRTLADLTRRLVALEQDDPPFRRSQLPRKGVHWVRPKLVAEIGFSEWTEDGQLRHPRFLGLRQDKSAGEVVRERPQA
jgi:bifunctional non-homologous end joining protein LigD